MMKLKFKNQPFQLDAVKAIVDCFVGQLLHTNINYIIDKGRDYDKNQQKNNENRRLGFKNADFNFDENTLLKNINTVQQQQNLNLSSTLAGNKVCRVNLDVEMETGTGKTYCYIRTMFELNRRYGWNKFIVIVPSIAIREGVAQSFKNMAEHFLEIYGKRAKFFIYNSKTLSKIEAFSSDSGINVMIINVQAFNATGKDARRIRMELDEFQSRKPINVIAANRPILILDEPQKMEGKKTLDGLVDFNPLFTIRYSATHKTTHDKVYRLDALDAYEQKLVKKITVRGIKVKNLSGDSPYLYLQSIDISKQAPTARVELEIKQQSGIKRVVRKLAKNDNLFVMSNELNQYQGFVVADIDVRSSVISFTNGVEITAGEAIGDVNEAALRRIQIRETISAHFEKEAALFYQGIKVLSLFFIDEVAKYRQYDNNGVVQGEYARIFEEEYNSLLDEEINNHKRLAGDDRSYIDYLKNIKTTSTHNGYFSIDKKTKHFIDPLTGKRSDESDDVDAYDLILKDKERLLSLKEPVRFIFSHSALREGWDNPNVFVICTLKHSDNTTTRRQEVGRGLRLCVNQIGDRVDDPAIVHDINILTVVANESYDDFVKALQSEISDAISVRLQLIDIDFLRDKVLTTPNGKLIINDEAARLIYNTYLKNDYIDDNGSLTDKFSDDLEAKQLAPFPEKIAEFYEPVSKFLGDIRTQQHMTIVSNDRKLKLNPLNQDNFNKREFQQLWAKINQKAVYKVAFDQNELINNAIIALDKELRVSPLQYNIVTGTQLDKASAKNFEKGDAFKVSKNETKLLTSFSQSQVQYDLIGKICAETALTRYTIAAILTQISPAVFGEFKKNPEDFITKASRLINEQKATMVIAHLTYDKLNETFDSNIFTEDKSKADFSKAFDAKRHIFDYVFTDSKNERSFVERLDVSTDVVVYAKLPNGFFIPTPVGNYNPDWAIAFKESTEIKHIYFVAETKGSLSSLELRQIEKSKIECAKKFFLKITSDQVSYDVVDSYDKLIDIVKLDKLSLAVEIL